MDNKKDYRLVCDMDGLWVVQTRVELTDHRADWMTVRHFEQRHEPGYHEAKKWMEDNL